MGSVEARKRLWTRAWRWWQELDALRGLVEFGSQAPGFISRWYPVVFALGGIFGGVVLAVVAAAVAYLFFLPAALMFFVGVVLSVRLLQRQTIDAFSSGDDDMNNGGTSDQRRPGYVPETTGDVRPARESRRSSDEPGQYHERFGCLWGLHLVRQVYLFAAISDILNAPSRWRISGPYCKFDESRLKFKDGGGVRELMDEDDVGGWGGSLYCPACDQAFRPDEGYGGKRTVETYRKQVEREVNS